MSSRPLRVANLRIVADRIIDDATGRGSSLWRLVIRVILPQRRLSPQAGGMRRGYAEALIMLRVATRTISNGAAFP